MSPHPSSSPSEGEIVESDSEKATTSLNLPKGTSVDRPFRKRVSVSRTPSPIRSPRGHKPRTESRSPYREPRGEKRPREDDHHEGSRNDPRRFKVRYEDSLPDVRSRTRGSHHDSNRPDGRGRSSRYEDRGAKGGSGGRRPRTRSQSPTHLKTKRLEYEQSTGNHLGNRVTSSDWHEQSDTGYRESRSKLSKEQSVSDRGYPPVAAAHSRREAEIRHNQTKHIEYPSKRVNPSTAKYVLNPQKRNLLIALLAVQLLKKRVVQRKSYSRPMLNPLMRLH